ncbi:MAG: hypothetical protein C5B60_02410 [Chloroflexi bacterium]|nr:MAG: hypothetical protein C5B60_02410 [Chloroflexota bacterium]
MFTFKIRRTTTLNSPPPALADGELGVELSHPGAPRIWIGTPTMGIRLVCDAASYLVANQPATVSLLSIAASAGPRDENSPVLRIEADDRPILAFHIRPQAANFWYIGAWPNNWFGIYLAPGTGNAGFGIDPAAGGIYFNGVVNAPGFNPPSDLAWKRNVGNYRRGLGDLVKIKPMSWRWNRRSGMPDINSHQYGFSAQDIEETIPEAVADAVRGPDRTTVKTVNIVTLLAVTINAVQELAARVERLEGKVNGGADPRAK